MAILIYYAEQLLNLVKLAITEWTKAHNKLVYTVIHC